MINVAINGYGNLGRGVHLAVEQAPDMQLVTIFSRRNPSDLGISDPTIPVLPASQMEAHTEGIDVCINCGGSATDLQEQGPSTTRLFHTVDSFDTHARIPEHFEALDQVARETGHVAVISAGWDPGLFSLLRVLGLTVLPAGSSATFWGPGVSQGHSDAIRRLEGVADARQYTQPVAETVAALQAGHAVELSTRNMHTRLCYVVMEPGTTEADQRRVEAQIKEMPSYFADYDTTVHFISAPELARDHSGLPHGGQVIHRGQTAAGVNHCLSFGLELDSNPQFTGSVLVAVARAAVRKSRRGEVGAFTMLDLSLTDLSPLTPQELRRQYL